MASMLGIAGMAAQPQAAIPAPPKDALPVPWAKPGPYVTQLSPDQESQYQTWVKQNNIPWKESPTSDYDMRGYWKAQQMGSPLAKRATNLHFPDIWKTPYHTKFSNESMYATPDAPKWQKTPQGKWTLTDRTGKVVAIE